ncbi:unnamed protein product [Lactuca virosa]|uniref:Uncharacterized protein n=1 Tax=Lactuca virosa TaxID=75947 RepID=A0AAU9NY63_9ASTR|nr:unnamed protein product [Lactuca virosa]
MEMAMSCYYPDSMTLSPTYGFCFEDFYAVVRWQTLLLCDDETFTPSRFKRVGGSADLSGMSVVKFYSNSFGGGGGSSGSPFSSSDGGGGVFIFFDGGSQHNSTSLHNSIFDFDFPYHHIVNCIITQNLIVFVRA